MIRGTAFLRMNFRRGLCLAGVFWRIVIVRGVVILKVAGGCDQ